MKIALNHNWNLTPNEAIKLQKDMASKVQISHIVSHVHYICGIDCAPSLDKNSYFSVALIWDLQTRKLIEYHIAKSPLTFPYIPGLLSFREIPAILEAVKLIQQEPDVIIVDGHGIAHPRRFGIASHLGILLDKPTFGCGKNLLYGKYEEPELERGSMKPLIAKGNVIGNVVRTRNNVKPVIISVGNKITLDNATKLTLECGGKYRLPEPTRLADMLVAEKQVKSVFL